MARKKIQKELQAKSKTFRLYDWEVDKVKNFIKSLRKVKYKIVDKYTKKSYGVFTDKDTAELWRYHYEDMYYMDNLIILKIEEEK